MLAGCEEHAVGFDFIGILDGRDLEPRAHRLRLRAQQGVQPMPRQTDRACGEACFGVPLLRKHAYAINAMSAGLDAQAGQAFERMPAHEAATQRIADNALPLDDQRFCPTAREHDRCRRTRRTAADDYWIFETHSRNGNLRAIVAPVTPASCKIAGHSEGR